MKKRAFIYFLIVISASILIFITAAAQEQPCDHVIPVGPWVNNAVIRAMEDETVCLRTGWAAMNYGLANAYTKKVKIAYSLTNPPDFEDVYGPQKGGWEYGGEMPVSEAWNCPGKWASGEENGHVFWWIHPLPDLVPGLYTLDFSTILNRPIKDPCDTDGDGKRPDSYTGFAIQAELKIYAPDGLGSLSGKVWEQFPDGSMGAPIQGIQWVSACKEEVPPWEYGASEYCGYSETDGNGEYRIPYLEPGFYRVVIWGPEWVGEFYNDKAAHDFDNADLVFVEGGLETINIDFSMVRAGFISGTVTDEGTGMPIPEIWVGTCRKDVPEWEYGVSEFCNGGGTDGSGYYEIPGLFPGDYRVVIWHPEWLPQFYNDRLFFDEADFVPVNPGEMTGDIDFALERAGIISGTVTDSATEPNAIPGAWVDTCPVDLPQNEWGNSPFCGGGETDEFGYYEIPGLAPGEYHVQIWHPEWLGEFYNDAAFFDDAEHVLVDPGEMTGDIDFELAPAGLISGTVMDSELEPNAIPGIWVDACEYAVWEDPFCMSAETDEFGHYTIGGLPEGNYVVLVWNQGYVSQAYDVDPPPGEPDPVPVIPGQITDGIDFFLVEGGRISGTVIEEFPGGGFGEGLPGVWVTACDSSVPSEFFGESPLCNGAGTDENGFYTMGGLLPGSYRLVIWGPDWVTEWYEEDTSYGDGNSLAIVTAGGVRENTDFSIIRAGYISGTLTVEATGIPIANEWVTACHDDVSEAEFGGSHLCNGAATDENGFYLIESLYPGGYRLVIWEGVWEGEWYYNRANYTTADPVPVSAGSMTASIDFQLVPNE